MRILAVDDEKLALEGILEVIGRAVPGAEVQGFRSAEDALVFAQRYECDIAFLDITMRGMDGIELARRLKVLKPKINIIFTTGYDEYTGQAFALHASGYVMKPVTVEKIQLEMEELRHPVEVVSEKRMVVRTFGNFEVFVDGKPLKFQYSKAKELLAYLVDRNGSLCSNAEVMEALWSGEDENSHISYLKNIRKDLSRALEEAGCEDAVIRQHGRIGIVPEQMQCDYFDWLAGMAYAINSYHGEYMAQYDWAQQTSDRLERNHSTR